MFYISGCCLLQESAAACYAGMCYYRGVWHSVPMGDVGQHTLPEFVAGAGR